MTIGSQEGQCERNSRPDPIRAWSSQKHAHIQFNILNKQTLLDARKNPEKYRDLVVRIAGYCAYFVGLSPGQQAEFIARTEEKLN